MSLNPEPLQPEEDEFQTRKRLADEFLAEFTAETPLISDPDWCDECGTPKRQGHCRECLDCDWHPGE